MLELVLFGLSAALFLAVIFLITKVLSLQRELSELVFKKSSQAVKYGKLTEQFIPFSETFPFEPEKFRFLGNPIDGIVFSDDKIIFCEFKTASSGLSPKQRRIKQVVEAKRVEWLEFRIS